MASADYRLCDACDGKAIYDADWWERVNPDDPERPWKGDIKVLCEGCAETHKIVIVQKSSPGGKPFTD